MSASEISKIESQCDSFKQRQEEYECLREIHAFEARHSEEVPELTVSPPEPPPFGLPGAESMLAYHKSRNTFNPVDPANVVQPSVFRPKRHSTQFLVKSVIPKHLTIPIMSPTMVSRRQRAQEHLSALLIRRDSVEARGRRERLRMSWNAQQQKFQEARSRRTSLELDVVEQKKGKTMRDGGEEDPGDEVRQMLRDLDEFDKKLKIEKEGARQGTLWAGDNDPPFLAGECRL
jgi:hypothetical protein